MELYSEKFHNKRKVQVETGLETGSEAPTPCPGVAKGGSAPWGGVVPSGTVSSPFLARNFPYLIKTTKTYVEKLNANFFLPKLLPIGKQTLQFSEFDF